MRESLIPKIRPSDIQMILLRLYLLLYICGVRRQNIPEQLSKTRLLKSLSRKIDYDFSKFSKRQNEWYRDFHKSSPL